MVGRQFGVWVARGALLAGLVSVGGCANIVSGVYGSDDSTPAPSAAQAAAEAAPPRYDIDPDAECPVINVPAGGASYSSGRSQITISNFARECTLASGSTVTIKIGVEGHAVLAAGASGGTYSAPLHIAIRDREEHVVYSKVIRVSVAVAPGDDQGDYQIVDVSSPIEIGLEKPLNSYDIVIGFDGKGAGPATGGRKKKHRG